MKVFKDIFSGDDMFSDAHVFNEVDGVFYEVEGKTITEKTCVGDSSIGGNKSAEEQEEELDDQEQTGSTLYLQTIFRSGKVTPKKTTKSTSKHTFARSLIILI